MLEKPNFPDEKIAACLQAAYRLPVARVNFLPLGADLNTAVYRAETADATPYFVKLRRGAFDEIAVTLPRFLYDQGIAQIIPPLPARAGQLWAELGDFKVMVYPFIEGRDGYEAGLSDRQWVDLGAALKRIHTAPVPPELVRRIPRETCSPQWRDSVRAFLQRVETGVFDEPAAAQAAAFLKAHRGAVADLADRAERFAAVLQSHPPEFVVCHSDLHAGNVLITAGGALFIVDWDAPILAPRERDLMYAGGGLMGGGRAPWQEEDLFYAGYGPAPVDPAALVYYRCERIIQDIAVECELLLLTDDGGADRERWLSFLVSNFQPGGVVEIACG